MKFSKELIYKYLNHKLFIYYIDKDKIEKYDHFYLTVKYVTLHQTRFHMTHDEAFIHSLEQGIVEQGVIDDILEYSIRNL